MAGIDSRRYVGWLMRAHSRLFVVLVALAAAAPAAAEQWPFHCDGTDADFFREREEAGWVGFGETWDLQTCAGEGRDVFMSGATRRWKKLRPQWSRAAAPRVDVEFYSTVFPAIAFGATGAIFGVAWFMGFLHRRRRVRLINVDCPSCSVGIPVNLDEPSSSGGLFCPSCGQMCSLVDDGDGVAALAVS
jgi:hypothetical protein